MSLQALVPQLEAHVESVRSGFGVQGIAVAIARRDDDAIARGFGIAQPRSNTPVDERTLFGLGSNTKAFTAAALQILAGNGRLSLDDRVEDHLPAFRMAEPYVSREVTVRDLLCHRSGLAQHAGDLLFVPPSTLSRAEIIRRVRHLPIAHSLRSRYAYSNVGYVIAGEVVASASGMSWDSFVATSLLEPLGMRHSAASHAGLMACANRATPHMRAAGMAAGSLVDTPIEPVNMDNQGAAAAISSCAADLVRWLEWLLGKRTPSGPSLSQSGVAEMWAPHMLVPIAEPTPPLSMTKPSHSAYGLGFRLVCYRGSDIVFHGGNIYGYSSIVTVVPGLGLAFAILCNSDEATEAVQAIHYWLLDRFLGLPQCPWLSMFLAAREARRVKERERVATFHRCASGLPASPECYVGHYLDSWFGPATVAIQGRGLALSMLERPGMDAHLRHLHGDLFLAAWSDRFIEDAIVRFTRGASGEVAEMMLAASSPLADPSFDYHNLAFRRLSRS